MVATTREELLAELFDNQAPIGSGRAVRSGGDKLSQAEIHAADPKAFSDVDIAQAGNQMLDDVFPKATPEEKREAFVKFGAEKQSGQEDPGMAEKRRIIAEAPEAGSVVADAEKAETGSRTETMGAMLSLVLPVLVGAAVGGKRGALHAAVGAGRGRARTLELEAQDRREREREDRLIRRQEEREERSLDQFRKREEIKREVQEDGGLSKDEQTVRTESLKAAARSREQAREQLRETQAIVADAENILKGFADPKISDAGVIEYQIKKQFSSNEIGRINRRIEDFVFKKVKAEQGSRPSDFDVQAMMRIVKGDMFSTDAQTAARLLGDAISSAKLLASVRSKLADERVDELLGRENPLTPEEQGAWDAFQEREKNATRVMSRLNQMVAGAKKQNMSRDDFQELIAARYGVVVADEDLKKAGF